MTAITRQQAIAAMTKPGAPYEIATVQAHGRNIRAFKSAPSSLRVLYETTASDKTFIVYENERLTFAEAWTEASRIGHLLVRRFGVVPGDRVAISMRNYPEWVLAFMAVTSIGAIAVAMNALWQSEEMAFGLADCGAKVLFADQERLQRLAKCAPLPNLAVIAVRAKNLSATATHLETLLRDVAADATMPAIAIAPDDAATIFYTSGSTGHPKGVVSTHRNILSALLSWGVDRRVGELTAGITPSEPAMQPGTLLAVPLFHVTGAHAAFLSCYRAQRRLVCMYRWDVEAAAALIERDRLTSFIAPAAMTGDLVQLAKTNRYDLRSLQAVGGGGAPRAPEQVRQIGASFGGALPNTGWGMTETNAIGAGIGGEEYLKRPASSGRCSLVLDLKVVDEAGNEVPAGERGELLVRGASVFTGYWNQPALNATIFADGWFRTGDVALIDDDGFVFIVDRIKDLIIRGGENIGCGQVEAALLLHPSVREAAVYAVPDDRLGEEVGATIQTTAPVDPEQLRLFLAEHLARFEVPRYIATSAAPLPRTATGKIHKRQIRDEALAALADKG